MNLIDHVLNIRVLIHRALEAQMERSGMDATEREEKLKPCVFTLFNRLAAIKLMEQKELFPEVIKQRAENGGLSAAHQAWLEEHPEGRSMERDGLVPFLEDKFEEMAEMNFRIYQRDYPYAMMPTADELNEIIAAFNAIENDPDCADTWQKDDILGWLYENFNTAEKVEFKQSGDKTEYDKVSLQSQVYTPSWVVKFLVDNTLGKLYLEMFPESDIDKADENGNRRYSIANRPTTSVRPQKDLLQLRLVDPACGSGNFLLYAFSMLYDLYTDQIENFGAEYNRREIPAMIVENNLYGVDLDERAVQLSQIGLLIKAREMGGRRARMPEHTNVVCTNFVLPDYEAVKAEFGYDASWERQYDVLARKIWTDLSEAHKFGTLVRVEEQLKAIAPNDDNHSLFSAKEMSDMFDEKYKMNQQIHNLVNKYSEHNSNPYTLLKMSEAMTFLDVISHSFDVVVANPPYTDSGDFGTELKAFVEENYKKPLKFNSNLYACFIKRCCELAGDDGKVGMVNPPTFMYIKTFEDTRKFILDKTHINLFVEWGYLGMFSSFARVDSAMFILEMDKRKEDSTFIKLNDLYEMKRKEVLFKAFADYLDGIPNDRVYTLPQKKLKGIKSYPFIYWISDEFREKFGKTIMDEIFDIRAGIQTSNNNRFLRYPWEITDLRTSDNDKGRWVLYAKGGPYCKWHGNIWLTIDWKDEGSYLQDFLKSRGQDLHAQEYYFRKGITYSAKGSGSISFREYDSNCLFDIAGSCIFPNGKFENMVYALGVYNSQIVSYSLDCLNPTVNKQPNDLKRLPFVEPSSGQEKRITDLSSACINIKKVLCKYSLIEPEFIQSPLKVGAEASVVISNYYNYENALLTQILLNESIINKIVFDVYELSDHDRQMVLDKEGVPVGDLPVSHNAKEAYRQWLTTESEFKPSNDVLGHLDSLEECDDLPKITDFEVLYQTNKEWEEFCIQHKMNPVEVWWQFKNAGVLPPQRTQTLAFELITDVIRSLLAKDDDGVIPLVGNAGEVQLAPRIEAEMVERGYSAAQIAQVFSLLGGGNLQRYLQERFFAQLSDHLNLFMYLPKTPFIWHLTSGSHHALELFVSIYKWNRDTLLRIKSVYAANREAALNDRLQVLMQGDATQKAEAAEVRAQLKELATFCEKIDQLLASGYNPKLDDGVGKNIAPLQKAGLISYEVLKSTQLKKYLEADW